KNAGWVTLGKTRVTVSTQVPGVTFAKGGTAEVRAIDPFGVATVRLGIALDKSVVVRGFLPITIAFEDPDSQPVKVEGTIEPRYNCDVARNSRNRDDGETPFSACPFPQASSRPLDGGTRKPTADQAGALLNPPQFEWRGRAFAVKSDESLVSPDLVVGTETF